jgi:BASS family bile acid:Na+ symporter
MSLAELIPLAIRASVILYVFSLGLLASPQDAAYLLHKPGLMVRSLLSMNAIMPLFAVLAASYFDLNPAIKIAIIALALSPVPPILPSKQTKAGGTASYAISMLIAAALFAIAIVPAGVELAGKIFAKDIHMAASAVALIVSVTILVPLVAGLVVGRVSPTFARRIAGPVSLFAIVLLAIAVLPVLFTQWPLLKSMVGNGTLLALILFAIVGLAVGHWLGGPEPDDRTDLALATAARHPAVALAIAGANFPDEKAVLAVVVWHLIVGAIVSVPYVMWRKRGHAVDAG